MRRLCLVLLALCLSGCEAIGYYSQAAAGQWELIRKREKISAVLQDEDSPDALRRQLQTVQDALEFAETSLALPAGKSYRTYVELDRSFVVWNVFATPAYSLQPLTWCYPIAGCVSYRGYFREERARRKASELQAEGYDVFVGGVRAYSTLGWLADPVLSTQLEREEYRLAMLLFHELAHQQVYVKGDTTFNESFATAVEREGLRRWLAWRYEDEERQAAVLKHVERDTQRSDAFIALVQQTVAELRTLYASGEDKAELDQGKDEAFVRLRERYQRLRADWVREDGGEAQYQGGFDGWFQGELNNARVMTVATYHELVPAFEALLDSLEGDLPAFYTEVGRLSRLAPAERQAALMARLAD